MKSADVYNALLLFNVRYGEGFKFRGVEGSIKGKYRIATGNVCTFATTKRSKQERSFPLRVDRPPERVAQLGQGRPRIGLINKVNYHRRLQFPSLVATGTSRSPTYLS